MDEITLENYRCFHYEQCARLAPLTLLVGENSTGKTSFLAMIRALSEITYDLGNPNFQKFPYDLGSFDEIAHYHEDGSDQANGFRGEFSVKSAREQSVPTYFSYTFGKNGTAPSLIRRRISSGNTWFEETLTSGDPHILRVGTARGTWESQFPKDFILPRIAIENLKLPTHLFLFEEAFWNTQGQSLKFSPLGNSPAFMEEDSNLLKGLSSSQIEFIERHLFASAPVRSKPRRTYDPAQSNPDSEGHYVPMYLADLQSRDNHTWTELKNRLEHFGKESGLFDEISIRMLGERGSDPFQVQISKFGNGVKGPKHNLIDVGYGVSQALPLITELLRPDAPSLFLLQQPEVHLHPSAQAALGSLFCQIASSERQLIVETHSDHLLDRVRMEVRDAGTSGIKPEDVSILFFERNALDVQIHSLRIDEEGNIVDAPNSYRTFFMQETARSLGL